MTSEKAKGTWFVLAAYLAWGLLPIYWKALRSVPSPQILSHRIFWSFILTIFLLQVQKRWPEARAAFRRARNRRICAVTAAIIGANWFIYIWAVLHDHILDASLGYFINPLFSVLLGVVFLKERLSRGRMAAVCLAALGVGYMTFQYGRFPWIAFALALTFGCYGLLRKTARVESLVGLTAETALLSPLVLTFLIVRQAQGLGAVGHVSPAAHVLLFGSGLVTAGPLLWFTLGVRRIPLVTAGFLQYIAPSLQLLLGTLVYGEPFTSTHLVSFSFIWAGLLIFSFSLRDNREKDRYVPSPPHGGMV